MTDRFRLGKPDIWLLIGLTLVALALRVYRLEAQSLWSDEGLSLYRSRLTLVENLSNVIVVPPGVPTRDTNPPLYFILLSGLRSVAGDNEYVLRFASVLAGVLLVPLLYVTGKRLFAKEAGIFAAILGAFSPFLVWYSQEARMYTLLMTLSVASVYLLLRAINFPAVFSTRQETERVGEGKSCQRWVNWIAWAVVTLAALYTHFTTFFLLLFEGVILGVALWRARRREAVMAMIGLGVLAVPLAMYAWSRAQSGVDPVFGFRPLDSIVPEVVGSFLVGRTNEFFQPWWAVLPGLLIFAVGLVGGLIGKRSRASTLVSALYLSVPLLAFYVVTFVRPLYTGPRHLALLVPPFYLLTALGLMLVWRSIRPIGLIALGAMLMIMAWWLRIQFTDPAYVKDDMRSLACAIAAQAEPADIVIVQDTITSFVFDYYYMRCDGKAPWKIIPHYPSLDVDAALKSFQAEANQAARLWFVNDPAPLHGFDGAALDIWARGHLLRLDHRRFPSIWLGVAYQLYTAHFPISDALPEGAQARYLTWPSDGLRLVGAAPIAITPDHDRAQVDLYWQLDRPAQRNYSFALRLVDRSGAEQGLLIGTAFDNWSAKQWPPGKIIQHSASIILPHGLPSGEYTLRVGVADRQTNEIIPAAGGSTEVDAAVVKVAP